jgi:AbiV family abortive infection protein
MEKRRFRNSTQQVVAAVQACLKNAVQLGVAATEQLHAQRPGLAVALIVLALEELGKLVLADGLAFAQPGDERAKRLRRRFGNTKRN